METPPVKLEGEPDGLLARFDPRRVHRGMRVSDAYFRIVSVAFAGGLSVFLAGTIMQTGRERVRKDLEEACGVLARGDELSAEHMHAFHCDHLAWLRPQPEPDDISGLQEKCRRQDINAPLDCIAQAIRRSVTSAGNISDRLIRSAQHAEGPCEIEEDNEGTSGENDLDGTWIY